MIARFNVVEIKARLSELVNQVALKKERLIVLRRGRPVAALVSIEDLRRLEALDAVSADPQNQGKHPVMRAFGGWADREDLDDLVEEIYANREATVGREVEF
jgi:prevent-host-death family protein